MSRTKFAVVYGAESRVIRRFIELDEGEHDDFLHGPVTANLRPGEAILIADISDHPVRNRQAIQAVIGEPAHSGRCCVVHPENGTVIDVVLADPLIDEHPDGRLVQHDTLRIGEKP